MNSSNASVEISNGIAWAAILAAGIGCAALGLFIDLAEGSKSISNALNFYNPVGNLSGKTSLGILVWLIAWVVLHVRWKNRTINCPGRLTVITIILIVLGIVASFPLFFGLFAAV